MAWTQESYLSSLCSAQSKNAQPVFAGLKAKWRATATAKQKEWDLKRAGLLKWHSTFAAWYLDIKVNPKPKQHMGERRGREREEGGRRERKKEGREGGERLTCGYSQKTKFHHLLFNWWEFNYMHSFKKEEKNRGKFQSCIQLKEQKPGREPEREARSLKICFSMSVI